MSDTWFTSDPHYFHGRIIEYCNRPFGSVEEMNEELIARHNSNVRPDDSVYYLGDISFGKPGPTKEVFDRLNGRKFLIAGNHDRSHIYGLGWDKVLPLVHEVTIDGQHVVMCHFPLLSWHKAGRGSFHLHGHTHNTIPFDPSVRRLDVGVDSWNYFPVGWEEVKTKLLAVDYQKDHRVRGSTLSTDS